MANLDEMYKALGRIEGKLEGICVNQKIQKQDMKDLRDKMAEQFSSLPCGTQYKLCQEEIKKKASWALILPILTAITIFASGAYIYMHESNVEIRSVIEKKHEITRDIIKEENRDAVEEITETETIGE